MKRTLITFIGILLAIVAMAQSNGSFNIVRAKELRAYPTGTNSLILKHTPGGESQIYVNSVDPDSLLGNWVKVHAVPNLEHQLDSLARYSGSSPTTISVGGLAAGSNIMDSSYSYILEKMLTPYQNPAFSSFTISGQSTTLEVGQSVSGTKSFAWAFSNSGNVAANTFDIYDVTASNYLATDISTTSAASVDVGTITKTTATSNSWRGYADNTNSSEFQSSNFTVNWRWRRYHGFSDVQSVNNVQVLALSGSELSTSKSYSATGSPIGDQYFIYAYPTSFGTLTSITVNGFPSIDAFTRFTLSVTNSYGVTTDYYVYYSNNTFNSSADITYN